jgi:flagellar biosynthesis protein
MSGSKDNKDSDHVISGREAVALAHDPAGDTLPRITAKGRGKLAEELIRLALEHHIPIKYDPDLVEVLSRLDEGANIPENVYVAVAELLSFIYHVNQEFLGKKAAEQD